MNPKFKNLAIALAVLVAAYFAISYAFGKPAAAKPKTNTNTNTDGPTNVSGTRLAEISEDQGPPNPNSGADGYLNVLDDPRYVDGPTLPDGRLYDN